MTALLIDRVLEKMRRKAEDKRPPTLPEESYSFNGDVLFGCDENFEVFDDLDDSLSQEAVRPPSHYPRMHQGISLKPLVRWLQSHIGQPWDLVYSELVVHPQFKKLREEAKRMVPPNENQSHWAKLYRDEDGIVCLRSGQRPSKEEEHQWWVDLPTGEVAVCLKGVYYAFAMERVEQLPWIGYSSYDKEGFRGKVGDYFSKDIRSNFDPRHFRAPVIYKITGKRQLGYAELKKYGLR